VNRFAKLATRLALAQLIFDLDSDFLKTNLIGAILCVQRRIFVLQTRKKSAPKRSAF
jgi:hypothetical protein